MNTMRPCSRCGGRGVIIRRSPQSLKSYTDYYCVCKDCGTRFPAARSVGGAIGEWNGE